MTTVVTGLGVVAPTGIGHAAHWRSVLEGRLGVRRIDAFDPTGYPASVAGHVEGFDVDAHVEKRLQVQTDRWTWLALAATRLALDDAGWDPAAHDPYATSVALASGSGGNVFGQHEMTALHQRGPRSVGAYQSIAWFYAASTGQCSIRHATKGPASVLVSEGAGGLDSLGHARRVLRRGTATVLAGGTEAPLSPYALTCWASSGLLSGAAEPREAHKPFDVAANGWVPGEGGAVLVAEQLDAARARGARQVYGEVAGYAATHDAHHPHEPAPGPEQQVRAIRRALADAGVDPADVGLVVADGAGVPALDALEAAALRTVFGERGVPVTTAQGLTGRLVAGGAALAVATGLLALRDGVLPPVGNLDVPDPRHGLDLVREPREARVDVVLVNARGFGGFNSAVVLRRVAEATREGGRSDE